MNEKVIMAIISAVIFIFVLLYIISKILGKNISNNKRKYLIVYLITTIISIFLYLYTENFFRILVLYIIAIMASFYLFEEQHYKTIIAVFFAYVLTGISEMLFALTVSIIWGNSRELLSTVKLNLGANIAIAILSILIIKNKKFCKSLQKCVESLHNVKNSHLLLVSVISMFLICTLLYVAYFEKGIVYILTINIIYLSFYSYFMYIYFKNLTSANNIKNEYKELLINLNEYERMYEKMRINNHENKNQLLVIKGMINKNNKKLTNYLDTITNTKDKADNMWFDKLKRIPIGGLKGLIYYKILSMQEKNINVAIHISNEINKEEFLNISEETIAFVCKIMGVFLDNAIEAVEKIPAKNISIEIYKIDGKIVISVSNNYAGNINISKLGEKGFSTKGPNRGHGLSIVKQIIGNTSVIKNERYIIGDIFQQVIKIETT